MPSTAEKLMSLDEFLVWERDQPDRYEYAGGVATMIAGGSLDHATIAVNLTTALRQAARGTGCRSFGSDAKVLAAGTVRYPDVSVTCRPVEGRDDIVPEPVVVIEVTSRSTEGTDRGRKKFDYFATLSIQQYSIVDQEERRVDLYTRAGGTWIDEIVEGDAVLNLSSVGVAIGLDAIYEDTELDLTRQPGAAGSAPAA
jgi:Uma2 family endonuclease